jgi:hypothetical protein
LIDNGLIFERGFIIKRISEYRGNYATTKYQTAII